MVFDEGFVIDLANSAIRTTALLGAPMLLSALVIGVMVSIFQAVTQINEQTLSFIPKIVIMGGILVLFGPWMMDIMMNFTKELIVNIPKTIDGRSF